MKIPQKFDDSNIIKGIYLDCWLNMRTSLWNFFTTFYLDLYNELQIFINEKKCLFTLQDKGTSNTEVVTKTMHCTSCLSMPFWQNLC